MELITRHIDHQHVLKRLQAFPVTAILGPRQCGKTTLARGFPAAHAFDLENPRDLARLENPQLVLEDLEGLIVIDEIQRMPELFELIRYLVDHRPNQSYLILGSASRGLIQQSSESLAGRIAYYHLGGFRLQDVGRQALKRLWTRGGFPDSFLAADDDQSLLWRENYTITFLERDIPQLGIKIPSRTLFRFWTMLAHYHGQTLNYSELARSFGIADATVKNYIDILEGTFMVRRLNPWYENIGKRLVKAPKLYVRDSGLFHYLVGIEDIDQLFGHPKLGASWEGFALESVCRSIGKRDAAYYFWKVHAGAELDLFWQHRGSNWGIEFKVADAPRKTRSMTAVIKDLSLSHLWVIYPGNQSYRLADTITVLPLADVGEKWEYAF